MMKVTKADFLGVIKAEPNLCGSGLATTQYWRSSRRQINFDENRQDFIDNGFRMFKDACEFLSGVQLRKTINRKSGSSYGLKHKAEKWAGDYISNGALIAAALHLGIQFEQIPDTQNVYLAVSSRCPLVNETAGTRVSG